MKRKKVPPLLLFFFGVAISLLVLKASVMDRLLSLEGRLYAANLQVQVEMMVLQEKRSVSLVSFFIFFSQPASRSHTPIRQTP